MTQLTKLILHGSLAEKYGSEHEFVINTPKDVISAMEANYPGFKAEIHKLESEGIGFQLTTPSHPEGLSEEDLDKAISLPEIILVERLVLSGTLGRILLGATLLAVGAAVPFGAVAGGTSLALLGGSLLFGGIMQWISPVQKSKEERRSTSFDQTTGLTDRNAVVPIAYGRVRIQPPVLSSAISTERIK